MDFSPFLSFAYWIAVIIAIVVGTNCLVATQMRQGQLNIAQASEDAQSQARYAEVLTAIADAKEIPKAKTPTKPKPNEGNILEFV